jgi:hypothetical protein
MTMPGFMDNASSRPLEFRLEIAVEVSTPADAIAPLDGDADASPVPLFLETAHALLSDLSEDLGVRMVWFTSPNGVRLVAQGQAKPEDLDKVRAAAAALGERAQAAQDAAAPSRA